MSVDQIGAYATRYWKRNRMEKWPTVREVARGLGISQKLVESAADDGDLMLTGYNVEDVRLGDLTVEVDSSEVEQAWCGYWLPYSRGCVCGAHQK